MTQRCLTLALVLAVLAIGATAQVAVAQTDEVAEGVDFRGYYVEPGAAADINAMEDLVSDFQGQGFGFVALVDDPAGGADLLAADVLAGTSARTVIVVSDGDLGAVSDDYDDGALSSAVDASFDLFYDSYVDGFRRFANELAGVPAVATTAAGGVGAPSAGDSSGGGGGGLLILLVVVVAVVGLFVWWGRRSKQRRAVEQADRLELLKDEVRNEMSGAANEILELEDRVRVADNDRASELYAAGAQGYAEFEAELDAATTPEQIHELGNKVDRVLWQLEASEAIIEGRDVPPEPVPEPFPEPEPPGAQPPSRDVPPELDLRRDRRAPLPPTRSGGGGFGSLGGLGSIAVILREMQRASRRRAPSGRSTRVGRSTPRSNTRVQVPRFPSSSRSSRRTSSRSSAGRSSRTIRSRPRGRTRRRR